MAKHQFGIMKNQPESEEFFELYEPKKYDCISIDDDFIQSILIDLHSIDCFWHSIENPEKGINYSGITLIAPEEVDRLISILYYYDRVEYNPLISLVKQAKEEGKYIIHFGI